MTATKVGIIYSVAQSLRRVVFVPDDDSQLPLKPRAGEAYIEQTLADYQQFGPDFAVQKATGNTPLSDRCVRVPPNALGIVSAILRADPSIDTLTGALLIQSDLGNIGDRNNNGVIERQYAQVNAQNVVTSLVWHDVSQVPVAANIGGRVAPAANLTVGATSLPPVKAVPVSVGTNPAVTKQ